MKFQLKERAIRETKNINLNTVRLGFEAFQIENDVLTRICAPVYSHGINNLSKYLLIFLYTLYYQAV